MRVVVFHTIRVFLPIHIWAIPYAYGLPVTRSAKTQNNPANNILQYKLLKNGYFQNISFVFLGPFLTKNSFKQLKLRYLLVGNLTKSSKM